jgi:hypothetical protein
MLLKFRLVYDHAADHAAHDQATADCAVADHAANAHAVADHAADNMMILIILQIT